MTARHWFRSGDRRFPFAGETEDQPSARWHADGRRPACSLADTSDGAWAEFLRHEEITDPDDLPGSRAACGRSRCTTRSSRALFLPSSRPR